MKIELEQVEPAEIESRSMEIIESELPHEIDPKLAPIIKRAVHTAADFDYVDNLCFSEDVVEKAFEAIKNGACIVTDTNMAKAGINKAELKAFLLIVNPFAPHIAEEIWETLGGEGFISLTPWPEYDEAKTMDSTVEVAVQICGKFKGTIALAAGLDVKISEVHGMAQRGGSVVTFVRFGEQVSEPVVEEGQADVIIAFELTLPPIALPTMRPIIMQNQ